MKIMVERLAVNMPTGISSAAMLINVNIIAAKHVIKVPIKIFIEPKIINKSKPKIAKAVRLKVCMSSIKWIRIFSTKNGIPEICILKSSL